MNVTDLLNRVREVYGATNAYCDRGTVLVSEEDGSETMRATFSTKFARSSGLEFEYEITSGNVAGTSFVLKAHQGEVALLRGLRSISDTALKTAVARLTGVTSGVAHIVPRLLLPDDVPGAALIDASEAHILECVDVDGESCAAVDLGGRAGSMVYVGLRDGLIRRVEERPCPLSPSAIGLARGFGLNVTSIVTGAKVIAYKPRVSA